MKTISWLPARAFAWKGDPKSACLTAPAGAKTAKLGLNHRLLVVLGAFLALVFGCTGCKTPPTEQNEITLEFRDGTTLQPIDRASVRLTVATVGHYYFPDPRCCTGCYLKTKTFDGVTNSHGMVSFCWDTPYGLYELQMNGRWFRDCSVGDEFWKVWAWPTHSDEWIPLITHDERYAAKQTVIQKIADRPYVKKVKDITGPASQPSGTCGTKS